MKIQIITNNPLVAQKLSEEYPVHYEPRSYREVLVAVRDLIHQGYQLYSHPLSGSVKPNETPYKSVFLSQKPGKLDLDAVRIIENSIITCDKFAVKFPDPPPDMDRDFQLLDLTLLQGALSQITT